MTRGLKTKMWFSLNNRTFNYWRKMCSAYEQLRISWNEFIHPCKHNCFLIQKKLLSGQCIREDKMSPKWSFNNNFHHFKTPICLDILVRTGIYNKINLYCFIGDGWRCVHASLWLHSSILLPSFHEQSADTEVFTCFNKELHEALLASSCDWSSFQILKRLCLKITIWRRKIGRASCRERV